MTEMTVDAAARDPWQLRIAIGVHPRWWQEEYRRDVAATLADVAAARGSLPVRDLVGLFSRGVVLRARSSMVFWLGLTLLVLEILAASYGYAGFRVERTWASILVHAGAGVVFAVPLVAVSAAWLARQRTYERRPLVSRLSALGRDAAAVLAFAAASYTVLVVLTLIGSGWPASSTVDLGYTVGFACMTISGFALGTLLGTVLPRVVAVPAAVALGLLAMISEGWQGGELRWRNVTGSALTFLGDGGVAGTSNLHITAVTAVYAGVLTIAAIAVVVIARPRIRVVAVAVVLSSIVLGSAAASGPLLSYVGRDAYNVRSDSQLHCSGTAPQICLWPEQDATDGPQLRATLTTAYHRVVALGIPTTQQLSAAYATPAGATGVWSSTRFDRNTVLVNYAAAVIAQGACLSQPARVGVDDQSAASYGLSLLLGAHADTALTKTFQVVRVGHDGNPYTLDPSKTRDYLGVHNREDALTAIGKWFDERALCATN